MICDKAVAELKVEVEKQLSLYRETGKQTHLNFGAYFLGLLDEIRSDFNAGGENYRLISEKRVVHGRAKEVPPVPRCRRAALS